MPTVCKYLIDLKQNKVLESPFYLVHKQFWSVLRQNQCLMLKSTRGMLGLKEKVIMQETDHSSGQMNSSQYETSVYF